MSNQFDPISCVAAALHGAALVHLPEVSYTSTNYEVTKEWPIARRRAELAAGTLPQVVIERRPLPRECSVFAMFGQTWGSTALGFGGLGGAAITEAYTTVIEGPGRDFVVYWNDRFAFAIRADSVLTDAQRLAFLEDIGKRAVVGRKEAEVRYGATW